MKIGFICPTSNYLFDPFRGDPHTQLQLLTILERADYEVELIDLRGMPQESCSQIVPECDVFLYSLYTLDFEELANLCDELRVRYPNAKHIAGGPHAMVYIEDTLQAFDAVAIGEGEITILEIVNDVMTNGLKQQYEQHAKINIDEYPIPCRHFLPDHVAARKGLLAISTTDRYDDMIGTTAIFSRGCPYSCAFCAMPSRKNFVPSIKYRSPANIKAEIEYLQNRYHISGLNLLDEIAIPLNRNAAYAHLEAIAETGIYWRGQTRADALSADVASMAAQAGCLQLSMGIESVHELPLQLINKRLDLKSARMAIGWLREVEIESRIYLICGLPGEPESVAEDTLEFLRTARPDQAIVSLFTVRPGTAVFDHHEQYGIEFVNRDWAKTMHLHGRYGEEEAALTFRYYKNAPWGKGLSEEEIMNNYRAIQNGIRELGMHYEAPRMQS